MDFGAGVICRPDSSECGIPIGYYLHHLYSGPQRMPATFPGNYIWGTFKSSPTTSQTPRAYLPGRARVFVFTVGPIGGDPTTIVDTVPAMLSSAGFKPIAQFPPPGRVGHNGDAVVTEYSRRAI
jgi:hypothetical protein